MSSPLHALEELPEKARAIAAQVPASARDLVSVSLPRFARSPFGWPESLFLSGVRVSWRFYVARVGTEVFFFWKKAQEERLVLDAALDMAIVPGESFEPGPPVTMAAMEYRFVLPPFVRIRPSEELLAQVGPPGARPEDSILFELGPGEQDLLVIRCPRRGVDGATITYTRFGRTVDVRPETVGLRRLWRPKPFLALIDAIRPWAAGGGGDELAMRPPEGQDQNDVWTLLLQLGAAYVQASQAVREEQSPQDREPALVDELGAQYDMGPFDSSITLRLTPDGKIAVKDEDDPLQLRMTLSVQRERRGVSAVVEVRPPDFLAGGGLREAFLDTLEKALPETSHVLGVDEARARRFLLDARGEAVVFRLHRGRRTDTDVFVLYGVLDAARVVAMLSGKFRVEASREPPAVELKKETLDALFVGPIHLDEPALPRDVVGHFLHLAAEIQEWIGVLS